MSIRIRTTAVLAMSLLASGIATALASDVAPGASTEQQNSTGAGNESAARKEPATLEVVEVIARKRQESIQDVPVAITAISTAQLESNLAADLNRVAELAPQVQIGRATNGTGGIITIRGVSSSTGDAGLDQSVSVSMDGVPLSRGRVVNSTLYDIAQVEVLQGPQALFFGKNSPAGAIVLRSADPTDHVEGYAKIGYEVEAKERVVEGAISGPISESLSVRLAVRGSWMDGWVKNVAKPLADPFRPALATLPGATFGTIGPDGSNISTRLSLLYAPSDDLSVSFKLTSDRMKMNSMNAYVELYCSGTQTSPSIAGIPLLQSDCKADRVKAESSLPAYYAENFPYGNDGVPYYDAKYTLAALNVSKSFGKMELASTTGLYDQAIVGSNNADYTELALIWSSQKEDYKQFTQELRLISDFEGPFNFMTGLYFEKSDRFWFNAADIFHGGYNTQAQNWTTFETAGQFDNKSTSGFGQLQWSLSPTVELSAGARYTRDVKEGIYWNISKGVSGTPMYPVGSQLRGRYTASNLSPEVTLRWQPSGNHTIYGGYKSGYKAGGLSNQGILLASFTPENIQFGAEDTQGFEVGYKSTLLENTLRFDATVYSYDYEGLQVSSFDAVLFAYRISNAAEAQTQGVSLGIEWLATDNLSFTGNLGYNRATYKNYNNAQCYAGQNAATGCVGGVQDLSGERLNRAPDLTLNLSGTYRVALSGGWKSDVSLGIAYSDEYQTQPDNHPGSMQDAFSRINAAVHVLSPSERMKFSLIGRNLSDEYYMVSSVSSPGGPVQQHVGTFARPREIMLQAEYRWR